MLDVATIRKDFKILENTKMQGKDLIYFDSAATSLKPNCVIEAMNNYYYNFNSNVHRGDYDLAYKADTEYENARKTIAKFINANENEVVFTSGTTDSLNKIALGYFMNNLNEDDEIILNIAEHASNILPWQNIANKNKYKILYCPLDENGAITIDNLKSVITPKTRLISIAYVSNVLGTKNDIKSITKFAHDNNILVVLDAAQAIPHMKIDVKDLDVDFMAFSSHKMCGPTGVGVLYGKYNLLDKMETISFGGGMNARFSKDSYILKKPPYKFEGGTPAIAEVIGFKKAIDYLESIGMDNIENYVKELKQYAISKLSKLDNIILYNTNDSSLITFNIKDVFCQDGGSYFNYNGIALRSGHHCAKLLPEYLGCVGTIRASLYFYNTKEEIDKFVEVCKHGGEFLDAFFK